MAQASRSSTQEYWRPANPEVARLIEPVVKEAACWNCGMEYPVGARFCHACGTARDKNASNPLLALAPKAFGSHQAIPSLVCFIVGILCIVAAGVTGAIYRMDSLTDWQAVQLWRIEWLLAAAVSVLLGIFLKR